MSGKESDQAQMRGNEHRIKALLDAPVAGNVESVLTWQRDLRMAVSGLVIERLNPLLKSELEHRFTSAEESLRETCKWANRVMRESSCSARDPKTNLPSYFSFTQSQARANDRGRIRFQIRNSPSRLRGATLKMPIELELVPTPPVSHEKSVGR